MSQQDNPGSPLSLNSEPFPNPPPYPFRGQALYLHSDRQAIHQASCLS